MVISEEIIRRLKGAHIRSINWYRLARCIYIQLYNYDPNSGSSLATCQRFSTLIVKPVHATLLGTGQRTAYGYTRKKRGKMENERLLIELHKSGSMRCRADLTLVVHHQSQCSMFLKTSTLTGISWWVGCSSSLGNLQVNNKLSSVHILQPHRIALSTRYTLNRLIERSNYQSLFIIYLFCV